MAHRAYTCSYHGLPLEVYSADKEKIYNRQTSAPILKRKSSRFGLGQLLSNASTNNHSCSVSVPPGSSVPQPCNNYSIQSHLLPFNCAPHGVQQLPSNPYQAKYNPVTLMSHTSMTAIAGGRTMATPNMLSAQQCQQLNEQFHHHGYLLNDGCVIGHSNMAAMFNVGAPGRS